jgi:hypothetical protein
MKQKKSKTKRSDEVYTIIKDVFILFVGIVTISFAIQFGIYLTPILSPFKIPNKDNEDDKFLTIENKFDEKYNLLKTQYNLEDMNNNKNLKKLNEMNHVLNKKLNIFKKIFIDKYSILDEKFDLINKRFKIVDKNFNVEN